MKIFIKNSPKKFFSRRTSIGQIKFNAVTIILDIVLGFCNIWLAFHSFHLINRKTILCIVIIVAVLPRHQIPVPGYTVQQVQFNFKFYLNNNLRQLTCFYSLINVISCPGYNYIVIEGDVPRNKNTTVTDSFHWRAYLIPHRYGTRLCKLANS